jgi:hypothetical protein
LIKFRDKSDQDAAELPGGAGMDGRDVGVAVVVGRAVVE